MKLFYIFLFLFSWSVLSHAQETSERLEIKFGKSLINSKSEKVSLDYLKGKIIGVYFSAQWCPPCKIFTPKLAKFYQKHQKDFAVVFVSLDHSAHLQLNYMKEAQMKWPAVHYSSRVRGNLQKGYAAYKIPSLIILSPEGNLISLEGRASVAHNPTTCFKKWQSLALWGDPNDKWGNPPFLKKKRY